MGTPFYLSKKFINRLATGIGILAVVIFIAANMLSIHAYNLHPTATQTPTSTATITKTPRPSPTPSITPTFLPEFTQIPELVRDLSGREYSCAVDQRLEGSLELVCEKEFEEINLQYKLNISSEMPFEQQIRLEPFTSPLAEPVFSELTLLVQIPFQYPWLLASSRSASSPEPTFIASGSQMAATASVTLPIPPSETPAITPSITSVVTPFETPAILVSETPLAALETTPTPDLILAGQITTWVMENQAALTSGETIRNTFDGLEYNMAVVDGSLVIRAISTSPQN